MRTSVRRSPKPQTYGPSLACSAAGIAFALSVSACDASRPSGAYDPTYVINLDAATLDSDAMPMSSDATLDSDAGFDTEPDGASADAAADPERARLSSLNGVYFMRMDLFSKPVAKALTYTVTSPTRVSYLYLVQVGWKDGQPKALERLCYQTFKHLCSVNNGLTSKSCTLVSLTTPASVGKLEAAAALERTITVKSGAVAFTTDSVNVPLGYDGTSSTMLPAASGSDPRVWTEMSPRSGLVVETSYTGDPSGLHCFVSSAQNFGTSISGTFGGSAATPTLSDATLSLKIDKSESVTLNVSGDKDCSSGSGDTAATTEMVVRFASVPPAMGITGFGVACPAASAWDTALKPKEPS